MGIEEWWKNEQRARRKAWLADFFFNSLSCLGLLLGLIAIIIVLLGMPL